MSQAPELGRKKVEHHAASVRKAHNVMDDSVSTVPDIHFKTTTKEFKDGHKVFTVSELEFFKESYNKEVDTLQNLRQKKINPGDESSLMLGDSLRFHRFERKNPQRPPPLMKDHFDVTGLQNHRKKIEDELNQLQSSLNNRNNYLKMSFSSEISRTLHPAMSQTRFLP